MNTNYISHHGIKGQKWGKRNGPPYPLDPETDYSSDEKKYDFHLTDKQKKWSYSCRSYFGSFWRNLFV